MSKVTKTPSVDDIRAKFASATQVYWVCPVTQKNILASDTAAISAHQDKVIKDMEAKEHAKVRQKTLRDLNSVVGRIGSLDELRAWALRRVSLDVVGVVEADMPTMSVHFPKHDGVAAMAYEGYIRLAGGKVLTPAIKTALGAKQGKSFNKYHIGKGVDSAWFMTVPLSSVLGKKISAWSSKKTTKLTAEEKVELLAASPEYALDIQSLKDLAVQIHGLREQANALAKKCEDARSNALTVLPKDLS